MILNKIEDPTEKTKEKRKQKLNVFLIYYFKWIVAFIFIVVLVAGFFLLLNPKYKKIVALSNSLSNEKMNEYNEKSKMLKNFNELINYYKGIKESDLGKIRFILPEEGIRDRFFTYFEDLANRKRIKLNSIRVNVLADDKKAKSSRVSIEEKSAPESGNAKAKEGDSPIGTVEISLKIGDISYDKLKDLLETVEGNLRIMDISNLDFKPDDGGSASLIIRTYFLKRK